MSRLTKAPPRVTTPFASLPALYATLTYEKTTTDPRSDISGVPAPDREEGDGLGRFSRGGGGRCPFSVGVVGYTDG